MDIKKRFVIVYFLRILHLKQLYSQTRPNMGLRFLKAYNNLELRAMKKTAAGVDQNELDQLKHLPQDELLHAIETQYPDLASKLASLAEVFIDLVDINPTKVAATVRCAGLSQHHLEKKPVETWTTKDHEQYWSLCEKAGRYVEPYRRYSEYLFVRDRYIRENSGGGPDPFGTISLN